MARAANLKLTSYPSMENYVSDRNIAVNFSENLLPSGYGKLQDNNVMCLWNAISTFTSVSFLQPLRLSWDALSPWLYV